MVPKASDIIEKFSSKTVGSQLPPRAKLFTNKRSFGETARFFWPHKTAANLAAKANASERMAKYWLSGKHEPSARAVSALTAEMLNQINSG